MDYIIGSVFSYFANKYFTFQSQKKSGTEIMRFIINIVVCYILAYSIARPFIETILGGMMLSISIMEQISMIFGMCVFIVLNYFGQKYFVFSKRK